MKRLRRLYPLLDALMLPVTLASAWWLKKVRRIGVHRLPISRSALTRIGVFPIRKHYYEPLFTTEELKRGRSRSLPGLDFNDEGQLALLERFSYQDELLSFPLQPGREGEFYYFNGTFEAGDAEFYYCMLRTFRPVTVIEIGAGYSSLLARAALERNRRESGVAARHICIEPFENPWLERSGAEVIRSKLEDVDSTLFLSLKMNDVLFIDSSHIIRPQGEVLREQLEILPQLQSGVLVHIHDIFTPRDYPDAWIIDEVRFWNEQYLLEAFLSESRKYKIIGALNYLQHKYPQRVYERFPILASLPAHEPGSFWIRAE